LKTLELINDEKVKVINRYDKIETDEDNNYDNNNEFETDNDWDNYWNLSKIYIR